MATQRVASPALLNILTAGIILALRRRRYTHRGPAEGLSTCRRWAGLSTGRGGGRVCQPARDVGTLKSAACGAMLDDVGAGACLTSSPGGEAPCSSPVSTTPAKDLPEGPGAREGVFRSVVSRGPTERGASSG